MYGGIRVASTRLKMQNRTIGELLAMLRKARRRVRRLEMLLLLAQRQAESRCEHVWEMEFPTGPRDNGEHWYRCSLCGATQ